MSRREQIWSTMAALMLAAGAIVAGTSQRYFTWTGTPMRIAYTFAFLAGICIGIAFLTRTRLSAAWRFIRSFAPGVELTPPERPLRLPGRRRATVSYRTKTLQDAIERGKEIAVASGRPRAEDVVSRAPSMPASSLPQISPLTRFTLSTKLGGLISRGEKLLADIEATPTPNPYLPSVEEHRRKARKTVIERWTEEVVSVLAEESLELVDYFLGGAELTFTDAGPLIGRIARLRKLAGVEASQRGLG